MDTQLLWIQAAITKQQKRFSKVFDIVNDGKLKYPASKAKLSFIQKKKIFTLSESLEKCPRSANIASAPEIEALEIPKYSFNWGLSQNGIG